MSVVPSIRNVALATAAALALFAMSSTEVAAQTTGAPTHQVNVVPNGLPPVFRDTAAQEAYNAKMRRVITLASTQIPNAPESCGVKTLAFIQDIRKYNKDNLLQRVLVNLSEDTLNNYARFVNCMDANDSKLRVVNTVDEDRFRLLMVGSGVIPNTPTVYGAAYEATRRTSSLTDRSGPTLAQNTK